MPTEGFRIKRVYDDPEPDDGYRVLVDRLWPRGMTKEAAGLDEWNKAVAPSSDLRRWIHEDPSRWPEFVGLYSAELDDAPETTDALIQRARSGRVTLLYAARNTEQNHAIELRRYLEKRA